VQMNVIDGNEWDDSTAVTARPLPSPVSPAERLRQLLELALEGLESKTGTDELRAMLAAEIRSAL